MDRSAPEAKRSPAGVEVPTAPRGGAPVHLPSQLAARKRYWPIHLADRKAAYACKLLTRKVTRDLTGVAVFSTTYLAAYP